MLDIEKFYEEYGLTDESIKLLLEYHPSSYIPFLYKYMTIDLYNEKTEQVSKWLNQIYTNACGIDMSFGELGKVYKHALIISDFKFKYTSGHFLDWFNIADHADSAELKFKIITAQNVEIRDIFLELRGWPGLNNLNFSSKDYKIVRNWYAPLIKELIQYHNQNNISLYFSYNMLTALMTKYHDSKEDITDIKQASLLMFGHACIKDDSYPLLDQIGKELYGNKFEHIYKTGESLDLLGSPDFWEANLHQLTSHDLPDMTFTN